MHSFACWLKALWHTLKASLPVRLSLLLFACACVNYFLPLKLAEREQTLSGEQVRTKAFAMATEQRAEHAGTPLQKLIQREALIEDVRKSVRADSEAGARSFDDLRAKLDVIDRVHAAPKPEVKFLGFVESKVHYLLFSAYFFLICHLCRTHAETSDARFELFSPIVEEHKPHHLHLWIIGGLALGMIVLSWLGHSLLRADDLATHGRSVFSFVNEDIGPMSYVLLLVRSFILCVLIATSWTLWAARFSTLEPHVATWLDNPDAGKPCDVSEVLLLLHRRSAAVKAAFESWQIHSIFLSAVFVPWMFYYWSLEDPRYYMSNLTMQIIWGITWWFVSAPALHAARAFERYRSDIILRLNRGGCEKDKLDAVRAESPVSFVNAVASAIAAGTAYFVPFVQKLLG